MNHLDEGTIHAWLDGALNATQSAEIDAHVKACAECSAKVAEARGLIAASSRILVSLDDVPANVIPRKAPVAPKRPRRMAPWVSGLAAAAILVTLWRTSGVEQPTARSEIKVPDIKIVSEVAQPTLTELQQPAPPPPTTRAPVEQRQSRVANQTRTQDGRDAGAGAGGVLGAVAAQTAPAAAPVASDLASRAMVDTARAEAFSRARENAQSDRRAALIPAPTSMADMAKLASDSVTPWVGCYRLPALIPLEEVVVTSVGEASTATRRTAGAPAPAARAPTRAPTAAVASSAKAEEQPAAFSVFRLDSVRGAQGFIVRDAATGNPRGTWRQVSADSVRLTLLTGPRMVGSRSRIACPEPRE